MTCVIVGSNQWHIELQKTSVWTPCSLAGYIQKKKSHYNSQSVFGKRISWVMLNNKFNWTARINLFKWLWLLTVTVSLRLLHLDFLSTVINCSLTSPCNKTQAVPDLWLKGLRFYQSDLFHYIFPQADKTFHICNLQIPFKYNLFSST